MKQYTLYKYLSLFKNYYPKDKNAKKKQTAREQDLEEYSNNSRSCVDDINNKS